jgi:pimeloyl-ACP methyl ester carboxylesterase
MVRGVDLSVTDTGAGPAFLWGHGFGSSVSVEAGYMIDWDRLAARHRIVRWDARGHGRSGGTDDPADYRWADLGRDLVALADAIGVDRFVAGGVSMGAATALHAAVQAPERIAGLVLVLPPTAYETRAAQAEEYTNGADLVEEGGVDAYMEHQQAQPIPEIVGPIAELYHVTPDVAVDLLPAVLRGAGASDLPPPEQLSTITAPTLVLAWTTDPGHPLSTAELLAERLPDVELSVARELSAMGTWTDQVERFLDRLPLA